MLIEPMIQQLHQLRLRGMAASLEQLLANAQHAALSFEERLSLMIQHEVTERDTKRLAQRLRWAKLPQAAVLEDLDTRTPRGIDPKLIAILTALTWIKDRLNLLITGPCGVGKSFIASALAHAACCADYSVRSYRLPRLVEELTRHRAQSNASAFLKQLAKVDLLYIDDFGLSPLADQSKRDLLEILEDRYDKKSTLITSQLPVDQWHAYIDEPTLADAILDRVVHNSYRVNLKGGSMRKRKNTTRCGGKLSRPATLSPNTNVPSHSRPACAELRDRHRVKRSTDMGELRKENRTTSRSLGIVRPDLGSLKFFHKAAQDADTEDREVAEAVQQVQQSSLLEDPLKPLDKPQYAFGYRYTSAGNPQTHIIHDWEVQAAHRHYQHRYGAQALDQLAREYGENIPKRNLHFLMGTMASHMRTFIVIGLLRSAFDPQELARQGKLLVIATPRLPHGLHVLGEYTDLRTRRRANRVLGTEVCSGDAADAHPAVAQG